MSQVAISVDFVEAYGRLRRRHKRSVRPVMQEIQRDPSIWKYDVSALEGADQMRALKFTPDCWAVVQPSGAGMVLHWVGAPQAAKEWAARHACAVHPDTGSSQVFRRVDSDMLGAAQAHAGDEEGVLANLTDDQVRRLGVPEDQVHWVRLVMADGEDSSLDNLRHMVPDEAYESLFDLQIGEPYDKIAARLGVNPKAVASKSVLDGVATAESKRKFAVDLSETDLDALLDAPLDAWRVFLHPAQRKPVERHWNGSVRILGGAGTGKTVVALHRTRWLARQAVKSPNMFAAGRKVLLLTYTRNLASELERHLESICTTEERGAIEVGNIDKWVWGFLARTGTSRENRLFGRSGLGFRTRLGREDDLWRRALAKRPAKHDLSDDFYWEEWRHVIQAQELMELDPQLATTGRPSRRSLRRSAANYREVKRRERGTRLAVAVRKAIFPVFEAYWRELWRSKLIEWSTVYRVATDELERAGGGSGYRSVVVDEAQDLGHQALRMIRAMVPKGRNDLMIVGDGHQRLYPGPKVVMKQCGIDVPGRRSIKLATCYRNSEATRKWAAGIMDGQPIYGLDDATVAELKTGNSVLRGGAPVVRGFTDRWQQDGQVVQIVRNLRRDSQPLEGVCVVARHWQILDRIERALGSAGIESTKMKGSVSGPGARLATMHGVKGMEFDVVVLVDVNEGVVPSLQYLAECADRESRKEREMLERSSLYVAATRARKALYVFSWGTPSSYLPGA